MRTTQHALDTSVGMPPADDMLPSHVEWSRPFEPPGGHARIRRRIDTQTLAAHTLLHTADKHATEQEPAPSCGSHSFYSHRACRAKHVSWPKRTPTGWRKPYGRMAVGLRRALAQARSWAPMGCQESRGGGGAKRETIWWTIQLRWPCPAQGVASLLGSESRSEGNTGLARSSVHVSKPCAAELTEGVDHLSACRLAGADRRS